MDSTGKKIFVVTGANKGIGYGIVRGLAQQLQRGIIYLTARNSSLGQKALEDLKLELGAKAHSNEIRFHQLDVTDGDSCERFAQYLRTTHGGFDVLVNNAGMQYPRGSTVPIRIQADETNALNFYGLKLATDKLAPLIRNGGRIVNICSQLGLLKGRYKDELIEPFKSPDYTEDDIIKFVEDYKRLAHENKQDQAGYPGAYLVSKAAAIALTFLHARQFKERGILVNACCPGSVATDLNQHRGLLSVEQGVVTPVWLALDESVTSGGQFYVKQRPKDWWTGDIEYQ